MYYSLIYVCVCVCVGGGGGVLLRNYYVPLCNTLYTMTYFSVLQFSFFNVLQCLMKYIFEVQNRFKETFHSNKYL